MGIAFQTLKTEETENIGFIIPSEIAIHFVTDFVRNKKYTGFGTGGFHWQKLESKIMRKALGLEPRQSGIRVTKIEKTSFATSGGTTGLEVF